MATDGEMERRGPYDGSKQETERRLLAHTLLAAGRAPSNGSSMGSPVADEQRLDEEVKAALAMKDFFRRSDLSEGMPKPLAPEAKAAAPSPQPPAQEKAREVPRAMPVMEGQLASQRQDPEPTMPEAPVVAAQAPTPAPERVPMASAGSSDPEEAIARANAVKADAAAYSGRVQRELKEARMAMLEAEKRYRELEAESKRTAEALAVAIRAALQEVEGILG